MYLDCPFVDLWFLTLHPKSPAVKGKDSAAKAQRPSQPHAKPGSQQTGAKPAAREPTKAQEPTVTAPGVKESRTKPTATETAIAKLPATEESATQEEKQGDETDPHWSNAPGRTRALAEITSASRGFNSLKHTFVFPSGPLEAIPGSSPPRLSHNQTNAAIHAYYYALSDILDRLDGIESYGFKGVREARRQLVVNIKKEMDELEKKIGERLGMTHDASTTRDTAVPETTESEDTQDSAMKDANEPAATVTDAAAPNVAPETSASADIEQQKPTQDVTMHDAAGSSAPEASKDEAMVEKGPAPSVPETVESTGVEPPESQAEVKDVIEADVPARTEPSTATPTGGDNHGTQKIDSHTLSPPEKPRTPTYSVSDEGDSEVEDAIKTCS